MEKTLQEWESWIENFRKTTLDVYERDWERVREDFASESRVRDDYKGRVLLELLQNADDAQVPETEVTRKVGQPEVEFRLTRQAFYCANGGHLITSDGLDSVCRLSHSAKDKTRPRIGEKGLGFKSVLGFTETPEVHSGNLHCRFNRHEAFDWVHSSAEVRKHRLDLTYSNVSLLRVPVACKRGEDAHDHILDEFLERYATVVKMPLIGNEFDTIRTQLLEIKPSILLFLNHLEVLVINIEGAEPKTCRIKREQPQKKALHEVIDCTLSDEGSTSTSWRVTKRSYDVPLEKVKGMGQGWEDVRQCAVAFALPFKDGQHIALDESFNNSVRVFFPTEESFPLPILFHATYYTDSSRKHLNAEHAYNQFVTERAAEFFSFEILPGIAKEQSADVAGHLDLLISTSQREKSIGRHFADLLSGHLVNTAIIPDCECIPRLASEVNRLPFDIGEWQEWYGLLGDKGCADLKLVHLDCTRGDRVEIMDELDIKSLTFEAVVTALEARNESNPAWFARLYRSINQFTRGKPQSESYEINGICEKSTLLYTSDKKVVSCTTARVFMPPDGEVLHAIPDWLGIKFIHREIVGLLGENKDQVLNAFLAAFGVKRYQTRDIVREVLSSNMRDYWDGKSTVGQFDPMQLLHFLFQLTAPDLTTDYVRPEGQTYEALLQVPVPSTSPDGNPEWSKAGETYFSKSWLGGDLLERLYGFDPASRYLRPEDYFVEKGNFVRDKLGSFFCYLGVENKPRITILRSRKVAKAVEPSSMYFDYLNENRLIGRSFGSWLDDIEFECTLDRVVDVMARPLEARILLNYLSTNPILCPDRNAGYKYSYYGEKTQSLSTNYFKWVLSNASWLYDDQDKPHRPREIYMPNRDLKRRFGDYLPYVKYQMEPATPNTNDVLAFLLRIGVKQSIDDFDAAHWYKILGDVASKWEGKVIGNTDAESIRGIYRDMLRSDLKIDEEAGKLRDDFTKTGKLLALQSDQSKFYPVNESFYVDRLDLIYQMSRHAPCFQVDASREERVRELFGVPSLSGSRKVTADLGSRDPVLIDPLNNFLVEAKPYLLARLRARRTEKADVNRMKSLTVVPVTRIVVSTILTHVSTGKQILIPASETDSLLEIDGKTGAAVIHLYSRIIKPGWNKYSDFSQDDSLILALSSRLAELFRIDLSEAFQLLLSRDNAGRERVLRDAHVDEEIIRECRELLSQEVNPEGGSGASSESTEKTGEAPNPGQPESVNPERDSSKGAPRPSRRLWGEDGNSLTFAKPIEGELEGKGKGGGGSPKHGHDGLGYQPDQDLRSRTDAAGMKLVIDFERHNGRIPDDAPSRQRGSADKAGPGCDIHSRDGDGGLVRRIEVKSSLSDDIESVELTHNEINRARNELSATDFYIYRVVKLDQDKYPEGPELLIFHDPYPEAIGKATTISIRLHLTDMKHDVVRIEAQNNTDLEEDDQSE